MSNPFGSVGKQLGGLAKHVVKKIVREPLEIMENAVGVGGDGDKQENVGMEAVETAAPTAQQQTQAGDDAGKPKGFQTQEDYQKYKELSGNRDDVEMRLLRRKLANEWGVEKGMEQARQEYQQKEQKRGQVEQKEKQQEKAMKYEKKKKDESIQVKMAKNASSAEMGKSMVG